MLMVILVLIALFWFLYRGWGPLEQQAQQADARATRIVSLEGDLRQNEARLTAVQADGTAVASERDTAINNHQLAERELNDQQQQIDLLLTRVFTQETAVAGQSAAQSVPRVTIIEPISGGVAQVNEPVAIVAVAADESGLALVLVARAGDVVTQTLAGHGLDGRLVGHVGADGDGAAAGGPHLGGEGLGGVRAAGVVDGDRAAPGGEAADCGAADAAGAAGDEGNLVGPLAGHVRLLLS